PPDCVASLECSMPRKDPIQASVARRHSYAQPPINERILEIHAIPGPTMPSVPRDAFRLRWAGYPITDELGLDTIQFSWKPGEAAVEANRASEPRLRFWRADRKRLYQVSPTLFVANDLLPEPGWDEFLPMFRTGYADFLELMQPRS